MQERNKPRALSGESQQEPCKPAPFLVSTVAPGAAATESSQHPSTPQTERPKSFGEHLTGASHELLEQMDELFLKCKALCAEHEKVAAEYQRMKEQLDLLRQLGEIGISAKAKSKPHSTHTPLDPRAKLRHDNRRAKRDHGDGKGKDIRTDPNVAYDLDSRNPSSAA